MRLEDWLKKKGITKINLATIIGVSPVYFYRAGTQHKMSNKICKKVVDFTGGEVTMEDLKREGDTLSPAY